MRIRYDNEASRCHYTVKRDPNHFVSMALKMWDRLSDKMGSILKGRGDSPEMGLNARAGNADLTPFQMKHSVTLSDAQAANKHLRIMEVEREILSHAIRRIYEIEANGKISKPERERLAQRYKERMMQVKNTIERDQSMLSLYNLECAQTELMDLFNKHLVDLDEKIRSLKADLGVKPTPAPPIPKEKMKRRRTQKGKRRSRRKEKTKVDERIEKIQADVDKALGKLEQIEVTA